MKKYLLLSLFFVLSQVAMSQIHIKENSFHEIPGYVELNKHYDDNNVPMALIKISTENISEEQRAKFKFKGNLATYFETSLEVGQIYVYISVTATFIEIMHPDFGKTEYWLPVTLKDFKGYEMVLVSDYQQGGEEYKPQLNYLIVSADQPNAMIYVNDEFVGRQKISKALTVGGTYKWKIECEGYHSETGSILLKEKTTIDKVLRPAFGFVNITTKPENGAEIFIDNEYAGKSPCTVKRTSGDYTIKAVKQSFKSVEKLVTVNDNDTTYAELDISGGLVSVVITTDPQSGIYIDNALKGTGEWKGYLYEGTHIIEARKDHHKTTFKKVEINQNGDYNIDIDAPTPICGTIDINSNPMDAEIYIDGQHYGLTPNIITDIIIGEHTIKLVKSGYNTLEKKIEVNENRVLSLNETLTVKSTQTTTTTVNKPQSTTVNKSQSTTTTLKPSTNATAKSTQSSQSKKTNSKKKIYKVTFLDVNFAYSIAPQTSLGLTFGQVKKVGWYASVMSGLNFNAFGTSMDCSKYGYIGSYLPFYSGETASSRFSTILGFMYRPVKSTAFKIGAGYGTRILAWETIDGSYIKNNGYSTSGIDFNAGMEFFLGGLNMSLDVISTNFNTCEIKVGLGFNF